MKIGILSDTHVSKLSPELIQRLKNLNLDLIIHCGVYTDVNVVHQLQALGKFCGVAGNMDSPEIKNILREKEVIEVEGKRIGIVHRYGGFFADRVLRPRPAVVVAAGADAQVVGGGGDHDVHRPSAHLPQRGNAVAVGEPEGTRRRTEDGVRAEHARDAGLAVVCAAGAWRRQPRAIRQVVSRPAMAAQSARSG